MTSRADLFRALGALSEPAGRDLEAIAGALGLPGRPERGEHASVFLFNAYPYASVYMGNEGMLGGEARDRVAGFWRALGLTPPAEPDHLASLLGLYAALIDREVDAHASDDDRHATLDRRSRMALLWEHLLAWLPPYLDAVTDLGSAFYAGWARLLTRALEEEARLLGRQASLPLHLRVASPLPEPEAPGDAWLSTLVTPVRTGVLLMRADLARAAADLGLGVRAGERSFMLRSLLEQDPAAVAGWLAGESDRWAARATARETVLGDVAAFWRQRAEATGTALRRALPVTTGAPSGVPHERATARSMGQSA